MSYLLTQMFLYLLVAFLLGLLLGWLLWRYNRVEAACDCDALTHERDSLRGELEACRNQNAQEHEALEGLRNNNIELQNRIDGLEASKVAPAPSAAVAAPVAVFTGEASKPESLDGPRGGVADPLQEINGVGPKLEKLLHSLGYYHFDQIGSWSSSDLAWVDANLEGFKGRATRDKWVPQAKVLAKQ